MLSLHPAGQRGKSSSRKSARIGLAIAGGGPIGGMYELGALRALDEALDGLDLTDLDSYVGLSSGAFLAAGLANRMSTADMCLLFITGDSDAARFLPDTFLRPALFAHLQRAPRPPRLPFHWFRLLLPHPLTIPTPGARWTKRATAWTSPTQKATSA